MPNIPTSDKTDIVAIDAERRQLIRVDGARGFFTHFMDEDGDDVATMAEASSGLVQWPDMVTRFIFDRQKVTFH